MISLRLFGPLAVMAADGRCLTPKGAKTQALLVLLALAPEMTRSRVWLQDKLWSDRGPDQAAASLRQAIYQLRGTLAGDADLLICDRRTVSLAHDRVAILPRPDRADAVFLEGLDVGDPEFEDWLSLQRMADDAAAEPKVTAPPLGRPAHDATLQFRIDPGLPPDRMILAQLVADMFAQALTERDLAEIRLGEGDGPADFILDLNLFPGARGVLRGQLQDMRSNRLCWSQTVPLKSVAPMAFEQARIARFVNAGIEAAWQAQVTARQPENKESRHVHLAVRRIFGYRLDDLGAADSLLQQAGRQDATPVAWQIFLRMVQSIERVRPVDGTLLDELDELIHFALLEGAGNSFALAAVAQANMKLLGRVNEGLILARKAVKIGPFNPFAYDALMNGLILTRRFQGAYKAASRASYIGQSTHAAHHFDMGKCLAALVSGRLEEARQIVGRVVATAPAFRSGLRYMAILDAHARRLDSAATALNRLRALEPGFDPRQIAEDADYPVASLRRSALPVDVLRAFY